MASVSYKINGSADNRAIEQTKQVLVSLGSAVNNVSNIFKGFVAFKGFQLLSKSVNETVSAFKIQQSAIAQLTQSISNNTNLSAGSLKRIIDLSGQLQKKSIFGDEALQAQAAYLSNLKLTESQIGNILGAATEWASTGRVSIEQATKELAKTLVEGKVEGVIKEQIAGVKALTVEQVKAGAAINLVAQNFKGMAETAAGTLAGTETQVANIVGDIKEKVGSVFGELKMASLVAIKPFLEKFDGWLDIASKKIVNMIRYFPEAAPLIGQMLGNLVNKIFDVNYIFTVLNEIGKYLWNVLKITWSNLGPIILDAFKEVFNSIAFIQYRFAKFIDLLGASLSDAFMGVAELFINSIISGINDVIATVNKIPGIKIGLVSGVDFKTDRAAGVKDSTGTYEQWKAADWSGALKPTAGTDVAKSLGNFLKDSLSNAGTLLSNITAPLGEAMSVPFAQLNDVLNRQVESTVAQTEAIATAIADTGTGSSGSGGISLFGDMSPLTLLMEAISPLIEMFSSLASVKMILDPLQIVFQAIFDVLQPIIDSLLRPLIGIFRIIGETIGKVLAPILLQLSPIIELIAKAFVFLYNYAIKPLANTIIWVISTIYNMVANLVNGVIKALNQIPFVNIGWRMATMDYESMKLQDISTSDLDSAGSRAGVGYSSGGASASYSGKQENINNFYIDIESINGTDEQAALHFWDTLVSLSKTAKVNLELR